MVVDLWWVCQEKRRVILVCHLSSKQVPFRFLQMENNVCDIELLLLLLEFGLEQEKGIRVRVFVC